MHELHLHFPLFLKSDSILYFAPFLILLFPAFDDDEMWYLFNIKLFPLCFFCFFYDVNLRMM